MNDPADKPLEPTQFLLQPVTVAGIVCAIAPFTMSFTSSNESTFNGVVTASYFRDYPAIVFGVLGLIPAALVLRSTRAAFKVKATIAALLFLFSARHLVYGFGVLRPGFSLTKPADTDDPFNDPRPVG